MCDLGEESNIKGELNDSSSYRRIIFLQAAQDRKGVRVNKDKDVEKDWVRMESPSFMQRGQGDFFFQDAE